ncbi:MAG: MFS transporter [Atopobiaceae bacterium]|jgi:PPP family 3-phenylpropionic acid transporter|nr:MFS transporter [Atopobiaceae bacterium]
MLWGMVGSGVYLYYIIGFAALVLVSVRLMPTPGRLAGQEKEEVSQISYGAFIRKYSQLMIIVGAMVLIYFCHMLVNTYFAKVIGNFLGPDAASVTGAVESIQGTTIFIQAMVELPAMFLFAKVLERFDVNKILVFSLVMFVVKFALTLVCGSAPMLYAISVLQMFSYALFLPATVYFANKYVEGADRNKGQ